MHGFTVLLSLILISLTLASEIPKRSKPAIWCNNRVPMADYFEYGYDLSEYDIFSCPEFGGKRAKFANLNICNKLMKFKFSNEHHTEYDVPDQFHEAYETGSTRVTVGHIYSSMSELNEGYLKSTASEHFFDRIDGIEKAMFKNSQFDKEMNAIFSNDSRIALVFYKIVNYQMHVWGQRYEDEYFTPAFAGDVRSLPQNFDGNEKRYLDFIEEYGTHIIMGAKFGAAIYRFSEINRQDYISGRGKDINYDLRRDVFALNDTLDILCEKKDGNRQILKVHTRNRNFTQVMAGGYADTRLYENRNVPLRAIKALPALVSSELKPISALISEDKRKNVEKAIKIYMAKAYIRSRVSLIQTLIDRGSSVRQETTSLLAQADQSANIYNEDELNKLGNELNDEVNELKYK